MVLQHISSGGGTIAVEVEGTGPLVICSPGMGDTRDAYAPLSAILVAQGYTVACMDNRGHGDSSLLYTGHRYGDEATADDFIAIAQELGKGKPAVLAGCSFSAGSATIAAGKRPDLIAGIILLGAFLRNPTGVKGVVAPYLMATMFAKPWGPSVWEGYAKTLWPGLGDQKAAERAAASRASLTRQWRWRAFQQTIKGLDHSVVGPWIPKVKAPVLVLMGDKDPDWTDPLEEAKWIASNFKEVDSFMVEGAGHAPMLERPDFVGEKVSRYLEKVKNNGSFGSS